MILTTNLKQTLLQVELMMVLMFGQVRLKLFNAELSWKSYRRGPRSQEVGEEGDYI